MAQFIFTDKMVGELQRFYTADNVNNLLGYFDDIEGGLISDEMTNEDGLVDIFGGPQNILGILNAMRNIRRHLTSMIAEGGAR